MKFSDLIENYPSPVIAIDNNGFVLAKNYITSLTFENVHVGAKISKYSDVDFTECNMSSCSFYGKVYPYFICKDKIEDVECYLMFISIAEYGLNFLPFNAVELYRNKLQESINNSELKNKKRQYIRSLHNNLLRANYFENFKALFTPKAHIEKADETVNLFSVCTALDKICENYFDDIIINIKLDHTHNYNSVKINKLAIVSIILNSLSFCIMNSSESIDVMLNAKTENAEIIMEFDSSFDFFELYKSTTAPENIDLNSSLALSIVSELSKKCGIRYKIQKERVKNKVHYTITHSFEATCEYKLLFSSKDEIMDNFERYTMSIFFNELD